MNFSSAIQAHSNWKLRLVAHCEGKATDKLDMHGLMKDDLCELGKWLHDPSQKYAADPKFPELVKAHALFHRAAGTVAAMIISGKRAEALVQINSRESDFGKLSIAVVGLLMGFRTRYGDT